MKEILKQHFADYSGFIEGDYIYHDGNVRPWGVFWGVLLIWTLPFKIVAHYLNK